MVVDKLYMRDFIGLGTWIRSTEDLKVCLNLLVDMFCFTIGLRVVCSGERDVVVQEFAEFLGKGGGELWTMIGDDFVIESKA